ncbi:hypothetical protein [Rhodococcus sp. NPDC127528]|uniref:hypothetical protein n=1 Tax=unclassified Rhodococcus (in: high G+C Gram-positive bacteria) TaxID=192944 RepID=UPI003635DA7F
MNAGTLYQDGTVRIDSRGVTIRHYYFPFVGKTVPYERIESVHSGVLPGLGGRWRIWGTTDFSCWYSLDLLRPTKHTAIVLEILGRGTPAFTPRDPDAVESVIAAHLARTG